MTKNIIGMSGFLSPEGKYYSIEEYEDVLLRDESADSPKHEDPPEHKDLAKYIIKDILKIEDSYTCSPQDYLIRKGWVMVRYYIDGGVCSLIIYNSSIIRFNQNPTFRNKIIELIDSGAIEEDISLLQRSGGNCL